VTTDPRFESNLKHCFMVFLSPSSRKLKHALHAEHNGPFI